MKQEEIKLFLSKKQLIKRGLTTWCFFTVVLFLVGNLFSKLVWTKGKSVQYTFFWKEEKKDIQIGDYVLVKGKEGTFSEGKMLTKKVMCMYPYSLKKEGLNFYCCDKKKCRYLHTAVKKTPKGTVLNIFNPCGKDKGNQYVSRCEIKIPRGKYYLGTEVPAGYDSRYMGFFDRSEIISVLKPIF